MNDLSFTTGEVASMLGVSPHTVRAWERRHLALKPARNASGQRRYTLEDVDLLRQIKHQRHAHHLSLHVATMAAQGLVAIEAENPGPDPKAASPQIISDPIRVVSNLIPEVVVVVALDGCMVWANTAFARFADRVASRMVGLDFVDFVDPYDRAKAVQTYSPPFRRRQCWELNLRSPRRRALFAFDSCPITTDDGPRFVLVGTERSAQQAERATGSPLRGADESLVAPHQRPMLSPEAGPGLQSSLLSLTRRCKRCGHIEESNEDLAGG